MSRPVSALAAVRRSRAARVALSVVAATAVGAGTLVGTASAADTCTRTIAPGTGVAPAVQALRAGETLCLRGGSYRGDVSAVFGKGTATAPITVTSYPGERATVIGASTFLGGEHWRIRGVGFTNPGSTKPIVRLLGGVGWRFEQNEVFDGAYAGMLVGRSGTYGVPHGYVIRENVVRDTTASNLYHNPSRHSTGGLIERNLFFNSGTQNVKLGWGGTGTCTGSNYEDFGIGEVTLRYNTLYNANQPLAVAEAGGDRRVDVHHNLIGKGSAGYGVRVDSVEGCLRDNVWVHDNAVFGVSRLAEDFGDQPTIMRQMTANLMGVDPRFDATSATGFRPTDARVAGYGRYAGLQPTVPTEPTSPVPGVLVVPCPTSVADLTAEVVLCA